MIDGQWKELAKATTVGYKKYLRVPDTTTDQLRIRILASRVSPTLSNFGLYYQPKRSSVDKVAGPLKLGLSRKKWKIHFFDSEENEVGNIAKNVTDGDPKTIWHTQWKKKQPGQPHSIAIDMGEEIKANGFIYLPRQDASIGGLVNTYEFHVSRDGINWGKPVAEGRFDNIQNNPVQQIVKFSKPVSCRYIKLTSTSGVKGQPFASAAEIGILR